MIQVCIAGATGWAGSELCRGVVRHPGMTLAAGVARKSAGENLATLLNLDSQRIPIFASVDASLGCAYDVLVEYTQPAMAKQNILLALDRGTRVVVGTSGLTEEDYVEIERAALDRKLSVLAVGNFALTAVLMQKFSELAAKFIPNCEIIDYASAGKLDCPSGTARELANRLRKLGEAKQHPAHGQVVGPIESRGARLGGTQVHSIRLPGYSISIESLFGLADERLSLRHDAGSSAIPYVQGALLAIERVASFQGLRRGLDSVMDFQ